MAYQSPNTCRFYINVLEWLHVSGVEQYHSVFHTLPVTPTPFYPEGGAQENIFDHPSFMPNLLNEQSFQMILGHNLKQTNTYITFSYYNDNPFGSYSSFVNYRGLSYNGWSLVASNCAGTDNWRAYISPQASSPQIGSMIIGTYWDAPHSCELKMSMSREMDGVKRVRTLGGSDLIDHRYIQSPRWGSAGAWEMYSGTPSPPELSRSSRRSWNLSFNYIDELDAMEEIGALYWAEFLAESGAPLSTETQFVPERTLLGHNDFYSQVLHRVGSRPFVFQADNTNFNFDNFAICKFDMKSFQFKQVGNGIYNIKLKIKEVW